MSNLKLGNGWPFVIDRRYMDNRTYDRPPYRLPEEFRPGASRKAEFGEGTPQQVSREGQNRRIADFGTVAETCFVITVGCP